MIMAKNSCSVVCEMSTMLALASASTADTRGDDAHLCRAPMTVTMMRFDLPAIGSQTSRVCVAYASRHCAQAGASFAATSPELPNPEASEPRSATAAATGP